MSTLPVGTVLFDGVSKRYRLGALGTLRSTLAALGKRDRDAARDLWALRDVSFRVEPGDSLGLIGPNGAGKTTALKLLSNITQPTAGRIQVSGRLSSLIELGAGFHPELSGRDNIFLNGAILGLKRHEIQRKLDEIIAFSELERFIDTPVKRYSSGMYVRLGFAVAAHVEPDVLLVDEVLAVGDASFRQKCVQRMDMLQRQGTTLLFVSHNMHLVQRLCTKSVFLSSGKLLFIGSANEAIETYERRLSERSVDQNHENLHSELVFRHIDLVGKEDETKTEFSSGETITLTCNYYAQTSLITPVIRVRLLRNDGLIVAMMATHHHDYNGAHVLEGAGQIRMTIPTLDILSGYYVFEVRVMDTSDSQLLATGRSHDFYVSSPGFGYEIDRGIYRPQVTWGIDT